MAIDQKEVLMEYDRIIILDACRYDTFRKYMKCKKAISAGSSTPEWFRNTFDRFYEHIYITANPHISDHKVVQEKYGYKASNHFKTIPVWDFGWNDKLKTVPPIEVIKAYNFRRPNKVILHFIQPHAPYLGSDIKFSTDKGVTKMADLREVKHLGRDTLMKAYERNLLYVLSSILGTLKGEWLITSDHGECFGEHGIWGHPYGKRYKELVEVPFVEVSL